MKIGVGFATFISNDELMSYARQTYESAVSQEHELDFAFAINGLGKFDYLQELEKVGTIVPNDENCVSKAWNNIIRELLGRGCRYVIVPNLDIIFKSDAIDRLVGYAEVDRSRILWTATQWEDRNIEDAQTEESVNDHPHFSCFMVDERLLDHVGPFDENFRPAYNEDLDMHWRIRLAGYSAVGYNGAKFFHYGSRTINCDPNLMQKNMVTHGRNDRYFIRKWGYKPPTANDPFTDSMYRYPFNQPNLVGLEKAMFGIS